jgi:hypothetical protein
VLAHRPASAKAHIAAIRAINQSFPEAVEYQPRPPPDRAFADWEARRPKPSWWRRLFRR